MYKRTAEWVSEFCMIWDFVILVRILYPTSSSTSRIAHSIGDSLSFTLKTLIVPACVACIIELSKKLYWAVHWGEQTGKRKSWKLVGVDIYNNCYLPFLSESPNYFEQKIPALITHAYMCCQEEQHRMSVRATCSSWTVIASENCYYDMFSCRN